MALHSTLRSAEPAAPTVFIIDDNDDIRETLHDFLEYEGFAVATASSGVEALQRVEGGLRPELILLDVMMPGMSGLEVLEKLRSESPIADVPVVVMSGSFEGEVSPPTYFLRKPFALDRVMSLLQMHRDREGAGNRRALAEQSNKTLIAGDDQDARNCAAAC